MRASAQRFLDTWPIVDRLELLHEGATFIPLDAWSYLFSLSLCHRKHDELSLAYILHAIPVVGRVLRCLPL
jgi:hypothetical protein